MFNKYRAAMFESYHKARHYFVENPEKLTEIERYVAEQINSCIRDSYSEIESDYNEASFLYAFWANYPPEDRGRAPVGDQVPWIEVGEQAVGHKLTRLISNSFYMREPGLPSGADNRFVLESKEISQITGGLTDRAFVFLDIKSVGPRDNFEHTVISPYQVSGDGQWADLTSNLANSPMTAVGTRTSHAFYPAIAPVYAFSDNTTAPVIHLFVKPIYSMLSGGQTGQPLESIKSVCVPNGLLLCVNPAYLNEYPRLFFPGKDDKTKDTKKARVRVSFSILKEIAAWRVQEI